MKGALAAFTLLEITVALLLTGILVVMAYGIIGAFTTLAARAGDLDQSLERIRSAQQALALDMDRSARLMSEADELSCVATSGSARYGLHGHCLLRAVGENVDTLCTNVIALRMDRTRQLAGVPLERGLVDRVTFSAVADGDTELVVVRKWYDARSILNTP